MILEIIIAAAAVAVIYGVYDSVRARREMKAKMGPMLDQAVAYASRVLNPPQPSEVSEIKMPENFEAKMLEASIRQKVYDLTKEVLYRNNFQITFAEAEAKAIDLIVEMTEQADRPLPEKLTKITPVVSDDLPNS